MNDSTEQPLSSRHPEASSTRREHARLRPEPTNLKIGRSALFDGNENFLMDKIGGIWKGDGVHLRELPADQTRNHQEVGIQYINDYYHATFPPAWAEAIATRLEQYGATVSRSQAGNKIELRIDRDSVGTLRSGIAPGRETSFRNDTARNSVIALILEEEAAKPAEQRNAELAFNKLVDKTKPAIELPEGSRHR